MRLRKLSGAEARLLCACGLRADERGHEKDCAHFYIQAIGRLRAQIAALEAQRSALVGPPIRRAIVVVPEQPHWRCATCNTDTFARSVRDPDRCTRCAASHQVAA